MGVNDVDLGVYGCKGVKNGVISIEFCEDLHSALK